MVIKGIFYAILGAFCFGIMPILSKSLYGETGVDPFFFLMIRYVIAAVLLWIYLLARKNRPKPEVNWSVLSLIAATALCYFIVTAAYFIALQYIDASLNSLLVFTFPVFTPFLGFLFFKEKLRPIPVIAAVVGFTGCALLIGGYQLKGVPGETLGLILGLGSGVIYAFYTLFGQRITIWLEPVTVTALIITIVAVFFLAIRLHWVWSNPQPLKVYLVAGIVAVISTILANIFYFEAIRRIGAVKAGIFGSFEPLFTTVLAIFFLRERMGLTQWLGALLIFGGMVIVQQPWKRASH